MSTQQEIGYCIPECLKAEVAVIVSMKRNTINGYHSISDFVLKNARVWNPQPLPSQYPSMTPKECFANAQQLVLENGSGLIYCEGYALGVIPVLHAWCLDSDGNVIDPTWSGRKKRVDIGSEYFGIAFNEDYIVDRMLAIECYHSLLDDWENRWPIFSAPVESWRHPINDL